MGVESSANARQLDNALVWRSGMRLEEIVDVVAVLASRVHASDAMILVNPRKRCHRLWAGNQQVAVDYVDRHASSNGPAKVGCRSKTVALDIRPSSPHNS